MSFYSQDSDVVRRKFTPKDTIPQAQETELEEKKLASGKVQEIDFHKLEKVKVVDSTESSGFHCKDCNLSFRDSVSWLDHLNSRLHQRNLGIEMRVEKSTFEQVCARIEFHKKNLSKRQKSFEETLQEKRLKEKSEKIKKKFAKKEKKQKIQSEKSQILNQDVNQEESDAIKDILGFSNFNSSKK